ARPRPAAPPRHRLPRRRCPRSQPPRRDQGRLRPRAGPAVGPFPPQSRTLLQGGQDRRAHGGRAAARARDASDGEGGRHRRGRRAAQRGRPHRPRPGGHGRAAGGGEERAAQQLPRAAGGGGRRRESGDARLRARRAHHRALRHRQAPGGDEGPLGRHGGVRGSTRRGAGGWCSRNGGRRALHALPEAGGRARVPRQQPAAGGHGFGVRRHPVLLVGQRGYHRARGGGARGQPEHGQGPGLHRVADRPGAAGDRVPRAEPAEAGRHHGRLLPFGDQAQHHLRPRGPAGHRARQRRGDAGLPAVLDQAGSGWRRAAERAAGEQAAGGQGGGGDADHHQRPSHRAPAERGDGARPRRAGVHPVRADGDGGGGLRRLRRAAAWCEGILFRGRGDAAGDDPGGEERRAAGAVAPFANLQDRAGAVSADGRGSDDGGGDRPARPRRGGAGIGPV
ncbi:MAG: N-acetyl-L,L-diaminopimelate deacetylase, partial [uncultured Sphingomonadaceae bacterium]